MPPEPPPRSEAGDLLTDLVLASFRLNAALLEAAQQLATVGGLTAAWWQVLGGVVDQPRSVAEVGRRMGLTRQAVQRIADLLVDRGFAEYRPNPAHKRAKLLAPTELGVGAIRQIGLVQRPWADRVGTAVGAGELRQALATAERLTSLLESEPVD